MNVRQTRSRLSKIRENYQQMKAQFWPEVGDEMLWDPKKKVGFIAIPRAMPYIMLLMDEMSNGKPVSAPYLALWCHTFEKSLVVIKDEKLMAFESGFSGQRAVITWRSRMKILRDLGFILTQPGGSGDFHYILIPNPYRVIRYHRTANRIPAGATYNALLERTMEIGAQADLVPAPIKSHGA